MPYSNLIGIILLAALCASAFPPLNIYPIILLILAPLLVIIRNAESTRKAMAFGWLFGALYMAILHGWMQSLQTFVPLPGIIAVWIAYATYLGLFFGVGLALIRWLPRQIPLWISAPAIWTLFEFLRSLGPLGNPSGDVGYAVLNLQPLPLVGALGGIYLVSFMVVLFNALLAEIIMQGGARKMATCFLGFVVAGIWMASGQLIRYHTVRNSADHTTVISLVQGNHPQMDKFNPILWAQIKADYIRLSANAPTSNIIIWPETITPTLNTNDPELLSAIQKISQERQSAILWGTPIQIGTAYYNGIVGVDSQSNPIPPYLKHQLMPFGEYWPFPSVLRAIGLSNLIGQNYSLGTQNTPLIAHPTAYIGTVICLESLYPNHFRNATLQGATILMVGANNAWFTGSRAADHHLLISRMRSIENSRWTCVASNTGRTAFIDELGNIDQVASMDQQLILTGTIPIIHRITPYTQSGNWIISICSVILGVCLGIKAYTKFRL